MMRTGACASERMKFKIQLMGFSERRTKVIDDQSDYYSAESNPFLTPEVSVHFHRKM